MAKNERVWSELAEVLRCLGGWVGSSRQRDKKNLLGNVPTIKHCTTIDHHLNM